VLLPMLITYVISRCCVGVVVVVVVERSGEREKMRYLYQLATEKQVNCLLYR
jgi:hypothetical protein